MASKKKLYTFVELDDNTPIQKLSVKDQLYVLFRRMTHDDADELKAEDALTISELTLKANLMEFIRKSTDPIRKSKKHSVTMMISNAFDPVLEEVLNSPMLTNYYDVEVTRPDIDYDVHYFIQLKLEVKTS